MDKLPKAIWEGKVHIGPVELECYVLDDGRRIISEDSMVALFEWMESGDASDISADAMKLAVFCNGNGVPEDEV